MRRIYLSLCEVFGGIMGISPDLIAPETDVSALRYQELAAAVIACEKIFHIEFEDERAKDLKTVEQWVDYIKERIADRKENAAPPSQQERESWYYR